MSIQKLSLLISTKIGFPPANSILVALAMKVMFGTKTS